MRFTVVILAAMLCLSVRAETPDKTDSDEALMAAAEKLMSEGKTLKTEEATAETEAANAKTGAATVTSTTENRPESEIPVFLKADKTAKSDSSLIWRMVGSIALIAVVGGAMLYATRRWSFKKNKGGERVRIEMLHQYHMGPRKSLALVRVAGEVILIGCTDHSINMLKPVTLIDDELAGVVNQNFNEMIEDEFHIEDMRSALTRATAREHS